jgi:hypothetical protein
MARIAMLARPEMLGDIFVAAGNRIPQAEIARFRSARDLMQGITSGDFDASIIANPDMPVSEIISTLLAENEGLFVVVVNGHNVPEDNTRVHVMKLDSNTAEEAVEFVVRSCRGAQA